MTQTVQWQQVADEMNCNRRGVYTNNPPTQGSSRCVCVTIHTDKNYFQRFAHNKPSRVHSTAQRCQTIIAMTPFYRQRTVTMHQQLRLVLSKTGAPHNETNCSRCTGHPSRAVTCYELCTGRGTNPPPTHHTQHDTMRIQINHADSKTCTANPYVRVHM